MRSIYANFISLFQFFWLFLIMQIWLMRIFSRIKSRIRKELSVSFLRMLLTLTPSYNHCWLSFPAMSAWNNIPPSLCVAGNFPAFSTLHCMSSDNSILEKKSRQKNHIQCSYFSYYALLSTWHLFSQPLFIMYSRLWTGVLACSYFMSTGFF